MIAFVMGLWPTEDIKEMHLRPSMALGLGGVRLGKAAAAATSTALKESAEYLSARDYLSNHTVSQRTTS